MRFVLLGDWPCNGGALCVPAGTVLEWDADPERARIAGVGTYPQWLGSALSLPLPINAKCLDQDAYDQMVRWATAQSDQLLMPNPQTSPDGSRPPIGQNGWVSPRAIADWKPPGLAMMDRRMDAQDAIDRAERTRHFNRLPLNGGE